MPPAFNLSQDQTLQFNPVPSRQSPLRRTNVSLKSNLQRNYFTCEHFQYSKLLHRTGANSIPHRDKTNRAITLDPSRAAPQLTRSTHTHRLFEFLKSDAVFPAAVSGEGRIIRIDFHGSTLFGVFTAKTAGLNTLRRICGANRQDSRTRTNFRLPT